jgi:hypothetical protein
MNAPNPYAFPWTDAADDSGSTGMTLRDYFAAKAMPALIAESPNADDDIIAQLAYGLADAMLIARNKT